MSPAAWTPGWLVARCSSTWTPSPTSSPASAASADPRRDADADDDHVGVDRAPVVQPDALDPPVALERRDAGAEAQVDAVVGVQVAVDRADLDAEHPLERHGQRIDEGDLDAELAGRGRDLGADPSRADDHDAAGVREALAQRLRVGERAQRDHAVEGRAGDRQAPRLGARGQQQPVVAQPVAVVELDLARAEVERDGGAPEPQLELLLGVEALAAQEDPRAGGLAAQEVLGERRALVRALGLGADEHDAAVEALLAQRRGGGVAGEARADDDEGLACCAHTR